MGEWLSSEVTYPMWAVVLFVLAFITLAWVYASVARSLRRAGEELRKDNALIIYMALRDFELYSKAHTFAYGTPPADEVVVFRGEDADGPAR